VLEYGHNASGGDAIAGGFVYRGGAIPALRGRDVVGDTSTGRLWWADFQEMLSVDGSHPLKVAQLHELRVSWNGRVYPTLFAIARFAVDRNGELYLLTRRATALFAK
jgi:hypothetical protein